MSIDSSKVVLVIPNYNGLTCLKELLPRVLEEQFDDIYIIDDASTDDSVGWLKKKFANRISVIEGKENKGPGGNRNRIISFVKSGIIVFLDADMELRSRDIVASVRGQFADGKIAIIGNAIQNPDGTPMNWNLGPEMHPTRDVYASALTDLVRRGEKRNEIISLLEEKEPIYIDAWGLTGKTPKAQQADWVAEGFCSIRAEVLAETGGYDEAMRYHETQDLSHRVRQLGYRVTFNPELSARHLELEVRENKSADFVESQYYFYKKWWGMSREVYDKLYLHEG